VDVSLILPRRCGVCGRPGDGLCSACSGALARLAPPLCARCGAPGAWPVTRCAECAGRRLGFSTARAAIVYDERARLLVRSWKEHGRRDLATACAALVVEVVPRPAVEALVPVPGDLERGLRRGHTPVSGLARQLGRSWGLPVVELLVRPRAGSRQRGLSMAERRRNVAHAFAVRRTECPRRVCLVDDVYTTGATAAACARTLRRAGVQTVEVVALARAVR
jgi:ComF family protein